MSYGRARSNGFERWPRLITNSFSDPGNGTYPILTRPSFPIKSNWISGFYTLFVTLF